MKKVDLETAMTYAGENYEAGTVAMPKDAAEYAVKRKFGKYTDESDNEISDLPEDFKPLSLKETLERMSNLDLSDEVLDSLKVYRDEITEGIKSGKPLGEIAGLSNPNIQTETGGQNGEKPNEEETETEKQTEEITGLSEDLPMRHVFAKLGENYDSDEKIKVLSRDDLIAVNGIAEGSADKIIAYLAKEK